MTKPRCSALAFFVVALVWTVVMLVAAFAIYTSVISGLGDGSDDDVSLSSSERAMLEAGYVFLVVAVAGWLVLGLVYLLKASEYMTRVINPAHGETLGCRLTAKQHQTMSNVSGALAVVFTATGTLLYGFAVSGLNGSMHDTTLITAGFVLLILAFAGCLACTVSLWVVSRRYWPELKRVMRASSSSSTEVGSGDGTSLV